MSTNYSTPDLSQNPPRSPRARLGGFVILPRGLDKARATPAGKVGEYHFNCPLDQRFLSFVGIEADAFLAEVKKGKSDGEILEWIRENSTTKPSLWDVAQWSTFNEHRSPGDITGRQRTISQLEKFAKHRDDIYSGFDLLDLDDYVTFGGKA